jgi:hypothetical protein
MAYLREERSECVNHAAHQVRKVLERFKRRFTADNPRMVERYVKAQSEIILHFKIEGLCKELVARFKRQQFGNAEAHAGISHSSFQRFWSFFIDKGRSIYTPEVEPHCDKEMVLVDVIQFAKLPQSVPATAFVRFGCVDSIYGVLPNSLYISGSKGWVLRGGGCDREVASLQFLRRRMGIGVEYQLVDDVVEGTSEVLKYVGGNGCNSQGDIPHGNEIVDAISSVRIYFDSGFIWAGCAEGRHRPLKILDVLFGPCHFRADEVETRVHTS